MKRGLLILLCALLLALNIAPAFADVGDYNLVLDEADLLTDEEAVALEEKAWALSKEYKLEICVLTETDMGGKPIRDYTADFYDENGYGTGVNHDGVMLSLDMTGRDWYILTTGAGIRIFTDYGIQYIGEQIAPYLTRGQYYRAFDNYLDLAEAFIKEANENQPYDVNHKVGVVPLTLAQKLGRAAPVGAVASVLATLLGMHGMKSGMKTVKKKRGARQYAREGSMRLDRRADFFLYHTEHRERIERDHGGGGGSSTFTSSSGTEHGGGGKF